MIENKQDEALLQAAANPALSREQAEALVCEARKNADIAFGAWAAEELTKIVLDQTIAIYENGARSLEKLGDVNKASSSPLQESAENETN